MGVNVFENNQWGTSRHMVLAETKPQESEVSFVTNAVTGDINSLRWIQSPLIFADDSIEPIEVHYSSLIFRDIMIASGKLSVDANRLGQNSTIGYEYSGKTLRGRRVMGILMGGALATKVIPNLTITFDVPDTWTLEDAATVPVVYITALCALFCCAHIKKGASILIHSGTGGVGQAARSSA